jgi:RHS repeat-associated protein
MPTVTYTVLDGEIVSENRDGVERDYLPDPLGSTVALLDSNQAKTDTFQYWPYGEERSRTGTTPTPFRFGGTLGYYRDSARQSYARARFLSRSAGRWMTMDPSAAPGGRGGYVYADDSPVSVMDPSGLQARRPPIFDFWRCFHERCGGIGSRMACLVCQRRYGGRVRCDSDYFSRPCGSWRSPPLVPLPVVPIPTIPAIPPIPPIPPVGPPTQPKPAPKQHGWDPTQFLDCIGRCTTECLKLGFREKYCHEACRATCAKIMSTIVETEPFSIVEK